MIVSNRLPVCRRRCEDGSETYGRASGGLVTALSRVLSTHGGTWVGWLGGREDEHGPTATAPPNGSEAYELASVELDSLDVEQYYDGFSNGLVWPLFHDVLGACRFEADDWEGYQRVNRKFAIGVCRASEPGDMVWVHDYHLMLVGAYVRETRPEANLSFFLHIPFPPPDVFLKLPWRKPVIDALLAYDLVGFQTPADLQNFQDCVAALFPETIWTESEGLCVAHRQKRYLGAGVFPISVDVADFIKRASRPEVGALARELRPALGRQLVLGIDRLDYTKGIPQRIEAFGNALERYPELRQRVTLLQVVVPSRTDVKAYRELKDEIDRMVGRVNGAYGRPGWTPIEYMYRGLDDRELLAYYRAADIALVTPLKDGMNLVAKEFCVCCLDDEGVLILSEFAGAATQLGDLALLVNPFDTRAMADAIRSAVTMNRDRRRAVMRRLRHRVADGDVMQWARAFIAAAHRFTPAVGGANGPQGLAVCPSATSALG